MYQGRMGALAPIAGDEYLTGMQAHMAEHGGIGLGMYYGHIPGQHKDRLKGPMYRLGYSDAHRFHHIRIGVTEVIYRFYNNICRGVVPVKNHLFYILPPMAQDQHDMVNPPPDHAVNGTFDKGTRGLKSLVHGKQGLEILHPGRQSGAQNYSGAYHWVIHHGWLLDNTTTI
jgi:hypothetical protein